MPCAYAPSLLLFSIIIHRKGLAVMYANTTALVRRQHRESAQETARAQQRLLDRVFLELIMIAQQVEGDAELSDYYVSSAGYGAYQGMTSLRRYLVTNDYLLDVGLLFSDGHLLTAQGSYSLAGYADRFNLPQIQKVYVSSLSERVPPPCRMRVPTWRCMTGRARCYIITATANRRWRMIPA